MNLLYSDVEDQLRASVADLLADRAQPASILARCETDKPHDLDLWRTLTAELGAGSLHVPESLGGQGASAREVAVVLEELGRTVAPVPFLGSAVLATTALLGCEPADGELLGALGSGRTVGALAVSLATAPGSAFPSTVEYTDGVLRGRVRSVADAAAADVLVVPAVGVDGPTLHTVRVDQAQVTVTPAVSLDLTRPIADVTFDGAASTRLTGDPESALDGALWTAAALLASEQVGVADWCLTTTVAYLKDRHQFGRPVGSFQALKHRLADLFGELALARAAARNAADAVGGPEERVAALLANSLCSTVAVHAAEECVQLHGGIGMTWEHPAHLYLKRAKADQIALGTPGQHRRLLAPLVDLPAPR
ncbi:acyl-CoA dehydrogenase family protein [Actinophytocola gossypii]|uniref:Acyl-CoA/acyl-ACP dehydrogenase n=1 Tax=Actinophytocola gossypii TaxID=2812003 RepID=A0ABT2J670_9PSEU|nr:acyl-CoA dehydrogenase family protein [Actinophytocola gossypii]MCT2583357.1 acyl-CoA/acyl-ACP dehydrogenase [Actinophytocola gossypii]